VSAAEIIELTVGGSQLQVVPHLGGSLLGWTVDGQPMLRTADAAAIAASDPLGCASFPLVPYSNRIGFARFTWQGQVVQLQPNFAPEPHSIHGTGWEDGWQVSGQSADTLALQREHRPDGRWPWPFLARQQLSLSESGLALALSVTNLADVPAPLAFGHHPYFDAGSAQLRFSAGSLWLPGPDGLPARSLPPPPDFDFSTRRAVAGHDIDHLYASWDGSADILWPDRPLALQIRSDMPCLVIYIPQGGDAFCVEPVPHITNALNLPEHGPQIASVAPGETCHTHIRLDAISPAALPG
jgi:aldose 1-epimerase